MRSPTGLLTRGSLPRRLPGSRQWLRGGGASPLTAAGPSRIRTGFPHRAPDCGRAYHRTVSGSLVRLWLPVVAWAALIFAFSSVPDLGTGLDRLGSRPAQDRSRSRVRDPRCAARPRDRTRRRGVRARRALRDQRRGAPVVRSRPTGLAARRRDRRDRRRRRGRPLAVGPCTTPRMTERRALAIELDAIGDTRPLWAAWLESARAVLDVDPGTLPDDRAAAASRLDDAGVGNWRVLLERFAEDHAPALPAAGRRHERGAAIVGRRRSDARRVHGRTRAARTRCALPARRDAAHLGGRDRSRCPRAPARDRGHWRRGHSNTC